MGHRFFISIIICLLTSCASLYNTTTADNRVHFVVEVDAYGDDSYLNSKKYLLLPADSTIDMNNLEYIEYSSYVVKILNNKGYIEVFNISDADIIIYFNYRISEPIVYQETESIPIRGQTGVSSVTSISNSNSTTNNGYQYKYIKTGSTSTSNINTTTQTYAVPQYGTVGYREKTTTHTEYLRFVHLIAYNINNNNNRAIWSTVITSSGSSNDLRKVIPYMLIGGSKYLGKSSEEKKERRIYENDERVIWLKASSNN